MAFGTLPVLCNHRSVQFQNISITPEGNPVVIKQSLPSPFSTPSPGNCQTTNLLSVSMDLPVPGISYRWNSIFHISYLYNCIQMAFCVRLHSPSLMLLRFIYVVGIWFCAFASWFNVEDTPSCDPNWGQPCELCPREQLSPFKKNKLRIKEKRST